VSSRSIYPSLVSADLISSRYSFTMGEQAESVTRRLAERIKALPKSATFPRKWVARQLLRLVENSDESPISLLQMILNEPKMTTVREYKYL
jgi:hypothetical protein